MKFVQYRPPNITMGNGKIFRCEDGDWAMDVSIDNDRLKISFKRLLFTDGTYDLLFYAENIPVAIKEILTDRFYYASGVAGGAGPIYVNLLPFVKENEISLPAIPNYSAEEATEMFCRIIRQLSQRKPRRKA